MAGFLGRFWFIVVTVVGLGAGLAFQTARSEELARLLWGISAAVGLVLAVRWVLAAIRSGEFGSDVLAVISILATVVTDEFLAAAVIALMLASGRALETWAEGRARNQLAALLDRAPRQAHIVGSNGDLTDALLADVPLGSRILVRSGEVVPLDGTLQTSATFDESALTGEPLPVYREAGSDVASGVVNSGASVELVTTANSETSTYASLIRLVEQAQAHSASAVRLANKWAIRFVPIALGLALLTWLISGDYTRAVAVIVAATPCPLILAVPVAIIAGMSKAASSGAIIKGGAALEQLARAKTVLLDKTGTLTHGGPAISEIAFAPEADGEKVLALAAALEQSSPHVVARAIVAEAKLRGFQLSAATEVREDHGVGLEGLVQGYRVRVGQPREALPVWGDLKHSLLVAIHVNDKLQAVLGLDDPVRAESKQTLSRLRALGVERFVLVSGDRLASVEAVAQEVGADNFHAECTPEEKLRVLRDEQRNTNGTVIAVGDGINDAPVLAAAGVGVAMGARGATAASEAADVVIVEDSIHHLAVAVDIAKGARGRALQASGFGMALATVAMLLASVGVLDATASAVSQELIDACAILWALVPPRKRI